MSTIDDPRLTTMGLFVEAYEGLVARTTAPLVAAGIDPAEFGVLLRLGRSPDHRLRMSDLAAQTTLSTSGITRVVDRLEREGLVERKTCLTDRRGFWATLTDAGLERLEDVLPAHVAAIQEWLVDRLEPDQLSALEAALRRVRDAVRPCATAGADTPRAAVLSRG